MCVFHSNQTGEVVGNVPLFSNERKGPKTHQSLKLIHVSMGMASGRLHEQFNKKYPGEIFVIEDMSTPTYHNTFLFGN